MRDEVTESSEGHWEQPLKPINIWGYDIEYPIIQGATAIGSLSLLAGRIASEWGVGVVTGTFNHEAPEYKELWEAALEEAELEKWSKLNNKEYELLWKKMNLVCLKEEITKAKILSGWRWPIFINIMVATADAQAQAQAAFEAWVDGIVCGAWIPTDLPLRYNEYNEKKKQEADQKWETREEHKTALIPILSSAKQAIQIINIYITKYGVPPAAIALEDVFTAAGHLWAKNRRLDLVDAEDTKIENSVPALRKYLNEKEFFDKDGNPFEIKIIAAGNVKDRSDVDRLLALWADAVQVWTRFAMTEEGPLSDEVKKYMTEATSGSLQEYLSNAGWMPARFADDTEGTTLGLLQELKTAKHPCKKNCLKPGYCWYRDGLEGMAQICLVKVLWDNLEREPWTRPLGEIRIRFAGKIVGKINDILPVKEVMNILTWRKD